MPEFEFVSRREAKPVKREIIELIHRVQNTVREYFTLDYRPVGSSSRNMITREKNGNKGFDFDVDLIPNVDDDEYAPAQIARILFSAIQQCMKNYGYAKIEDSTSVITIKVIDSDNSKIKHSCDFAIIRTRNGRKQYIRYNKLFGVYSWEDRGGTYADMEDKLQWIIDNGLKQELRERYLINKNGNRIPTKKSRAIFAETVNNIFYTHSHNHNINYSRYAIRFPFG